MKQSRRWVVWLATLLIATSLVALPREGAVAVPIHDPLPPVIEEGDPDDPYAVGPAVDRGRALPSVEAVSFSYVPQASAFLPGPRIFHAIRSLVHLLQWSGRR